MQLKSRITTAKPESKFDEVLEQALLDYFYELASILNKGLYLKDNFNAEELSFTTDAVANLEFSVAHTLKRTPSRFFVVDRDKAGILYKGTTAWDGSNVHFKCNVASVVMKVYIY